MSLNDLNISKKLAGGFAVVVTVVTAMCVVVFLSLQALRTAVHENDIESTQQKASEHVLTALVERQNAVRGMVASGDKSFQEKIDAQDKDYRAAIAEWAKLDTEDATLIASIRRPPTRPTRRRTSRS
jgi:methyl-accepting chemotaxis protein